MSLKTINEDGALVPAPRNLPTELFVDFERRDDDAILAELQGAIVEEYVYSFRQGGQTVMGLSLPGVMAVAQNMGGITCGQPIWTLTDEDITCDISATDHKVGLTVWGTASAPLRDNRGPDKFARAKALSKAQRNAIRKVIPETVATQMLKAFIGGKPAERQRPPAQMQRTQPAPQLEPPPPAPPVEVIQNAPQADPEMLLIERTEILNDLRDATDRRDLSAFIDRIKAAGLNDDSDIRRAYSAAQKRLSGGQDTSDAQPSLIG